jgi:phosphate transport system substrate-binding protein
MRKVRLWLRVLAVSSALGLVAVACGGGDDGGSTGGSGLTGSIDISGSSTVEPISSLVAELFNEDNPDVAVTVNGPGTGDGFALFCQGETDISDASRPIEDEEAQTCADAGIDYVELEVAFDGITVMTNPANSAISCLSIGDLYALFGPESVGFESWADANDLATAVGGNGGLPDEPLEITAPGEESGTFDAFIELAGIDDTAIAQGVPEDKAAALRSDYTASANDNVIIQAMEGSDTSLGFVGFAYAQDAGDQIKELGVDAGDGCVEPSADAIADGSYPLSRSLYIYVNKAKLADNEALKAFVDLYLSDTGIQEAVSEVGYITLPPDRVDATRSTWEATTA